MDFNLLGYVIGCDIMLCQLTREILNTYAIVSVLTSIESASSRLTYRVECLCMGVRSGTHQEL